MESVPREQGEIGHDNELFGIDTRGEPVWALVNGGLSGRPPHDYRDIDEAIPIRRVALRVGAQLFERQGGDQSAGMDSRQRYSVFASTGE